MNGVSLSTSYRCKNKKDALKSTSFEDLQRLERRAYLKAQADFYHRHPLALATERLQELAGRAYKFFFFSQNGKLCLVSIIAFVTYVLVCNFILGIAPFDDRPIPIP